MNVTASTQQHVEVPQIEQEFFLMIGWAIFILKGLYTKMMVIREKKLVWADKTVLCTTSHMLEWQWKHGKYSILDPETIRCSSLHISALG